MYEDEMDEREYYENDLEELGNREAFEDMCAERDEMREFDTDFDVDDSEADGDFDYSEDGFDHESPYSDNDFSDGDY